jgi:hypothetical protein
MKKLAIGIGMLLLLAIVMPAVAAPAVVNKNVDCNLIDAEGHIFTVADSGREVGTSSNNANSMIVCKAQLDPLTQLFPDKAVKWDFASTGIYCSTGFGITEDYQAVITPSGDTGR